MLVFLRHNHEANNCNP